MFMAYDAGDLPQGPRVAHRSGPLWLSRLLRHALRAAAGWACSQADYYLKQR
jgi:hypothetical protein